MPFSLGIVVLSKSGKSGDHFSVRICG
jgi:hypothetical protein